MFGGLFKQQNHKQKAQNGEKKVELNRSQKRHLMVRELKEGEGHLIQSQLGTCA